MTIKDTDALTLVVSLSLLKAQIRELTVEIERLKQERNGAIVRAELAEQKLREQGNEKAT